MVFAYNLYTLCGVGSVTLNNNCVYNRFQSISLLTYTHRGNFQISIKKSEFEITGSTIYITGTNTDDNNRICLSYWDFYGVLKS
jgi:hypothetical protein